MSEKLKWQAGSPGNIYADCSQGLVTVQERAGGFEGGAGPATSPILATLKEAKAWCQREVDEREHARRMAEKRRCPHCGAVRA